MINFFFFSYIKKINKLTSGHKSPRFPWDRFFIILSKCIVNFWHTYKKYFLWIIINLNIIRIQYIQFKKKIDKEEKKHFKHFQKCLFKTKEIMRKYVSRNLIQIRIYESQASIIHSYSIYFSKLFRCFYNCENKKCCPEASVFRISLRYDNRFDLEKGNSHHNIVICELDRKK